MKIDWKHLATTPGYISLKAAMLRDINSAAKDIQKGRRPMRDKHEFHKQFRWVISRATYYAYHTGEPIHEILNRWEEDRTYWWLNYYQNSRQPKRFHSDSIKPMAVGTYYRKDRYYRTDPIKRKHHICRDIMRMQADVAKKRDRKPRWSARCKRIAAYRRKKEICK